MMRSRLTLLIALLLAAASPASGQARISAGQTISGRLESSDPSLADGTHYDDYSFTAQAGDEFVVTMRSTAFDAFLSWGQGTGASYESIESDDDSAGGTDSELRVTIERAGSYVIRANALSGAEGGAYTLTLEAGASAASTAQRPISPGETINERLTASDGRLPDSSWYDDYVIDGRVGQELVITMRSSDFDAFLHWGQGTGAAFHGELTNDDGAGGTDSQIRVTPVSNGQYVIRANSLSDGETGAYSLTVEMTGGSANTGSTVRAGQTIAGSLASTDPTLSDDSHYDDYVYNGAAGEEIVITLRSADFDAFLHWGEGTGAQFESAATDDDSAGDTDSQIRATIASAGTYVIRVNSLSEGETGSYTLSVEPADGGGVNGPGGAVVLRSGQEVSGRLESSDPTLSDGSYYDTYTYRGQPGEEVVIRLTSSDFDAFLRGGRTVGGEFQLIDSNDDGAGNTNAELQITLDESGSYVIQANSFAEGSTGSYTLFVRGVDAPDAGGASLSLGQSVTGQITATDPTLSDNSHYDLYVYRGAPGDQVLVTMESGDFDAYLAWGRLSGDDLSADLTDDDSGGGTNAQLVGTVGGSGTYAIRANTLRAGETGSYTLSLRPVSGPSRPAEGGAATISPGQTITGALARTDVMLSDSSYFDQYTFRGEPGQQLQITLRSPDFDTYLHWGRLAGGNFISEATDDDGAGGSDSQLLVTVGGDGTYAVRANSYAAAQSGSYSLEIVEYEAGAAEGEHSGATGKWLYTYSAANPQFRSAAQRMKDAAVFEDLVGSLNSRFNLPRPLTFLSEECGYENAFYSPSEESVTFCYELFDMLTDIFVPDGQWTTEQREAVDGAVDFILMHEVGHAFADVFDLPITGREEDAVDQLATLLLVDSGEKGAAAALNGVRALQPAANDFDNTDFADEHSLGPVRMYNVLCWIYGSNPEKYRGLVDSGTLPRERAVRCPSEYEQLSKSWRRLLEGNTISWLR